MAPATPSDAVSQKEAEQKALDRELIDAAWANDIETAAQLIDAGADVNAKDSTEQSAYLIATSEGYLPLLELTLENGADVSSLDLAVAVTGDALTQREIDRAAIDQIVFGSTIPQPSSFYAAPWVATQLGLEDVSGPLIAQACATSVACLVAAAAAVESDAQANSLVVTTDRTSNGPLLVYPRTQGMGGSPATEHWVLDSFAADPATGQAMVATAENVALDGRMTREALDELTLLRWQQYQRALADDRRFQRQYMQPISIAHGRKVLRVEGDEGVHPYTADSLRTLK